MRSFLSVLRTWAGVGGEYGLEAPTHMLRALYMRAEHEIARSA